MATGASGAWGVGGLTVKDQERLKHEVERDVERLRDAERSKRTLLAQTVYLGTVGLLFAVPIVAGAYIGRWIDGMVEGYSIRWTISLILLGVGVGAVNVYLLLVKE
ncbi:AtpZ/AtpI family protein [Candidatus Nitrospira inopinata]|uniref:ATP synthase (Modular protein) n=1 Tax=Candidatus Nitrospira inopinata TaxID=1715989 RepID=A0A0S4KVM5_9BACT|nr:AtpZ/AtpI family protein [Candidatus Nitrospira inopinata]CUQ65666.1 ATP synthase (modular protein) [Candidatus Nitrospira inopinata]